VGSQYFLLTADVMLGDAPLTLQSVLYRTPEGKMTVLNRRLGPSRELILTQFGGNF
jgi:type II secretory pathway component PulK